MDVQALLISALLQALQAKHSLNEFAVAVPKRKNLPFLFSILYIAIKSRMYTEYWCLQLQVSLLA